MTEHTFIMGATLSGKSFLANDEHKRFAGKSVFVNTKPTKDVAGVVTHTVAQTLRALGRGKKVNFRIEQDDVGRVHALRQLKDALYRVAPRETGDPWGQIVVDEAQKYRVSRNDPTGDLVRVAGGLGLRVLIVTQYPTGVDPEVRSQCDTRIVFKPGIEGTRFLRSYGEYPTDEILDWTNRPYHFVSYSTARGWVRRRPI